MKLVRAIEILDAETHYYPQKGTDNRVDAIQLGIEALKEIEQIRLDGKPHYLGLLPGETPE